MVLLTLKRPRVSCVPGFFPFRRSTFSVTARKPRWIQEYMVLKLRTPTQHLLFLLETKFVVTWIQLKLLIEVLTLLVCLYYQTY